MIFRTIFASITVVLSGIYILGWATDSFTVWTSETARRKVVLANRAEIPNVSLVTQSIEKRSFNNAKRPVMILDFIFTRCPTVCINMGFRFQKLQEFIHKNQLQDKVELLSVSFDTDKNERQRLNGYLKRYDADQAVWVAATPVYESELKLLLDRFGVIIIENEFSGYTHNAAIYLLEQGKLTGIYDIDDLDSIKRQLLHLNSLAVL